MTNETQNPTVQPSLNITLSKELSSAIRGASRMVGVTPEHLADQLLADAIEKARNALLGKPTDEQLFTLSGISGRAFRDLKRLAPKESPDLFDQMRSRQAKPEMDDREGNK